MAREIRSASCKVCTHPDRVRIELLRVGGASLDALSAEFKVSRDSIHRHAKNHITTKRKAELMCGPVEVDGLVNAAAKESKSLLDYLRVTRSVLFSQFLACAEASDRNGVAAVAGRLLESLRELGRISGEIRQVSGISFTTNTLNIVASPEFATLSTGLLDLSRRFPEARADIISLLRRLDAEPAAPGPNGSSYLTGPSELIEGEMAHVE
jgi:hypothetical protein